MDVVRVQDLDAERCLLAALMFNNSTVDVDERDFDSDAHRLIFQAIERVQSRGEHPDFTTVKAELGKNLDRAGGQSYLLQVYGADSLEVNLQRYVAIVRKCAVRRRVIEATVRIRAAAERGDEVDAHALLDDAEGSSNSLVHNAHDFIDDRVASITTPREYIWMNDFPGVHLHRGDLFVIGARPAVGKSTFALQLVSEWCSRHLKTRVYSLEMSTADLVDRLIQQRTPWGTEQLDKGLDADQAGYVATAMHDARSWPFSVVDRAVSVEAVCADMRRFARQGGRIAVIDYLGLLVSAERGRSRYESVTEATRSLKITAMDTGLLVVALSQLNRNTANESRPPTMADLRDSGAIEQDADDIALIHRFDDSDEKPRKELANQGYILDHEGRWPLCQLDFCKLRRGRTGRKPMYFDRDDLRFVPVDRRAS